MPPHPISGQTNAARGQAPPLQLEPRRPGNAGQQSPFRFPANAFHPSPRFARYAAYAPVSSGKLHYSHGEPVALEDRL
jgi:hypothetical protein